MLHDLMLRKMEKFVWDVREDNYRYGKLVDLSVSWKAPHILLSNVLYDNEAIEEDLKRELESFDSIIKNLKRSTWIRATLL